MKKLKKLTAWMLVAVLFGSSLVPGQNIQAKQDVSKTDSRITNYGEGDGTDQEATEQQTSEEATTEQQTTEKVTTEEAATEQQTTEKVTTEQQTTTEEATTEQPTTEKPANNFVVSKLSPSKAQVIVLDPGHCGIHTGAHANGLNEEDVVLDISYGCKEYLDNYGDVTVYMTRWDRGCCQLLGLGDCLASRNYYAKQLEADFLISMHINAGASSGANVLAAYRSGYNDSIRVKTQALGKKVLERLSAFGVANRGFLLRTSGTGNRYPNGSLADYYSIVRKGVELKIPSIIIEHGYVTNLYDCNMFFRTQGQRKSLGIADAQAIISYYNLNKEVISGKFVQTKSGTYYKNSKGKKVVGWVKHQGSWYYFDKKTAKMKKGLTKVGNYTYFLSQDTGAMQAGWITVNGSTYFAKGNGVILQDTVYTIGGYNYLFNAKGQLYKKGMHSVKDGTYYVDSQNHVIPGMFKIKGKYYAFSDYDSKRLSGYQYFRGKYYYFSTTTGAMLRKRIVTIDGEKYYMGSSGTMKTGWITYKSNKYYFNSKTGKMMKGWVKIKGKFYYFDKNTGKMQKNKWIGKYYVNRKGVRTKKR
ncbi:MAG: N-acetylmuramoyl-L-alanine amidase [Bacteroidales bacterium]|nr:N-acetylmuramoyl-L-alanine amidase [Clostridium sp.]MCM1203675.1 N-acetylmuramoyl-L-alanine amidase [Bacteroidales bacterium]